MKFLIASEGRAEICELNAAELVNYPREFQTHYIANMLKIASTNSSVISSVMPLVTGGGGPGTIGISPARTDPAKIHVSAIAIAKRFMDVSPFGWGCKGSYIGRNRTTSRHSLQACILATNIPLRNCKFSYTHIEEAHFA